MENMESEYLHQTDNEICVICRYDDNILTKNTYCDCVYYFHDECMMQVIKHRGVEFNCLICKRYILDFIREYIATEREHGIDHGYGININAAMQDHYVFNHPVARPLIQILENTGYYFSYHEDSNIWENYCDIYHIAVNMIKTCMFYTVILVVTMPLTFVSAVLLINHRICYGLINNMEDHDIMNMYMSKGIVSKDQRKKV